MLKAVLWKTPQSAQSFQISQKKVHHSSPLSADISNVLCVGYYFGTGTAEFSKIAPYLHEFQPNGRNEAVCSIRVAAERSQIKINDLECIHFEFWWVSEAQDRSTGL